MVTTSVFPYLASQPVEHQTDVTGKRHLQENDEVDDNGIISSIIIAMLVSTMWYHITDCIQKNFIFEEHCKCKNRKISLCTNWEMKQ